jgi:hypothetical protein
MKLHKVYPMPSKIGEHKLAGEVKHLKLERHTASPPTTNILRSSFTSQQNNPQLIAPPNLGKDHLSLATAKVIRSRD